MQPGRNEGLHHLLLLPQAMVPPSVASGCLSLYDSGWDRTVLTCRAMCCLASPRWGDLEKHHAVCLAGEIAPLFLEYGETSREM